MHLFFSVGEPSGDLHGANLIRQLRAIDPQVRCVGYGGPRMQAAGCDLHIDLTEMAVMWFLRVLLNLHRFWHLVGSADRYFRHQRPDAVVLIDYPGFNWWIARRAKAHGIPVFYYGAPQIWAWAGWRIEKMRRLVDYVLCKLPFEAEWYRQQGCAARYIGHPYFDELATRRLDPRFLASQQRDRRPLVTLLPGSRTQEVTTNLPVFLHTARLLHALCPETRFAVACFREEHARFARQCAGQYRIPIECHVGRTPELIAAATTCLACSGSVCLELLYHEKPSVIHYKISRLAFQVQRAFRKVRYITLVNLLASENRYTARAEQYDPAFEEVPFPEFLTWQDRSGQMARILATWMHDPSAYQQRRRWLMDLKRRFATRGASRNAAEFIYQRVKTSRPKRPVRLHFTPSKVA